MTTTLPPTPADSGQPEPLLRFSVERYHLMIDAGLVTEEDRVELLEGLLVKKMTKHPPHALGTELTCDALRALVGPGWFVNCQDPVTLEDSEPEPDATVVRGRRRDFDDHHPGPQDLGLLVEVADSSYQRDSTTKKRIYARAKIVIYWIVNLVDGRVEVYTDPTGPDPQPDYRGRQDFGLNDRVPVVLGGKQVGDLVVRDLLP